MVAITCFLSFYYCRCEFTGVREAFELLVDPAPGAVGANTMGGCWLPCCEAGTFGESDLINAIS